jgi:RHS repeat-associated protein
MLAAGLGPVLTAGGMALPPAAVAAAAVAGAAAVTAASVAAAPAARAATPPGKALVLLQNGETTAPETTALQAAGWTVDQATPAQWLADSAATFKSYAVLVIGDPSTTSSCSTLTPTTATSGTGAIGTTWQSAVSGNVAVLGTAPAAAGTTAAGNLMTASAGYAAAGYSSSGGTGTGLYVSLNCEYKTAAAKTPVPLLNGVEGIGTAGGLAVKGGLSCSDPGTVNKWEASSAGTFGAVTSGSLGAGAWTSAGCPVQEAFSSWPTMLTPVAFDAGSDVTANFTASDGVSGQPYALLGHPVPAATAALAPGTGGEVAPLSAVGGSNPAAPGVNQATAGDPVNTESGDFTQSAADLSVPGFGPALDFSRTYDAQVAQRETVAGTPGPLGYGWTDNWATSLTLQRPVTGDIYTVSTPGTYAYEPVDTASDGAGDVFYVDATANDVVEVAAAGHTQFGISMTAGDAYVVAGSAAGTAGDSGDGGPATSALLYGPWGLTLDGSGDLFIADMGNNRVQEVPAASGTQFGISMTANDMYTVAGSAAGTAGSSGDGGPAASALLSTPGSVQLDRAGDLYISDSQNFRVQEVPAASGTQHGQSMTAGYAYTVAGQAGTSTYSGDGGPAASARFVSPAGMALDAAGDLYVADDYTDVVREVPAAAGTQWGQAMTAGDIYTVAGNPAVAGTGGSSGDGGPATSAELNDPIGVTVDSAGDLYVADTYNDRLQEVPASSGTQWGQSMTAGNMYTVINAPMTQGDSGDGGPAAAAGLNWPGPVTFDASGDMLVPDALDGEVREVFAATSQLFTTSPAGTGITVNQADGDQVTFYPKDGSGNCSAPYVAASGSGYCTLPQNVNATLTYNSTVGTYTYTPSPGTSYTYSATTGALKSESDTAGDTLTVTAGSPSPGSGNCPSAASSCTTITAASGRTLVLGYNSGGLVTSATDPLGRRWAYAYNSAGQLTSATDPMTNVTSYSYGTGSTGNPQLASDLLTITSPNAQPGGPDAGKDTVNVYDSSGRVTSQTDPMGYQTTFSYCVNAAAGDCMNPATGTGLVTVHDTDGNSTVYSYQQGTLASTSKFTGSTLTSETDQQPNTTSGTLLDTSSTDGDGNTTTNTYSSGNLTVSTAPGADGSATATSSYATQDAATADLANCVSRTDATVTCQQDSPPAPVAPGSVITPPTSVPPEGTTYTLFDTDGNELYTTTGVYEPGTSSAAYSQTVYQLFKGNSITLNGTAVTCTATPPSMSLPCATINADGVVTQLGYNAQDQLESSSTPDGNSGGQLATTTYAYNADGEPTSTVSPDGNLPGANSGNYTTTTAYNADGQRTSVTQGGGAGYTDTPLSVAYGYDADGNAKTATDARGYTTTTGFNADDQAVLATNPDGDSTLSCYNSAGGVAETVPPAGVAAGSLTSGSCPSFASQYSPQTNPLLASDATMDVYNADGQKTAIYTPAPAGQSGYETTTYTYDADGNVLTTTAPPASDGGSSQVALDTYNPAGELATETTGYGTAAASTVSFCYDPVGSRTSVVSADGNASGVAPCETSAPWAVSATANPAQAAYQTTSSYDSVGELVSTTSPTNTATGSNGATTTHTYDPEGNTTSSTSPGGVTTTWTFTPDDQPASMTFSGASAHAVTYGYDAEDDLTSMTDGTGTSTWVYSPFGEAVSETDGAGSTVSYGYSPDGKITSITYPLPTSATWATSDTVNYGYDHADALNSVTDFNGHQITVIDTADGLPSGLSLGASGDTVTRSYDNADGLSQVSLANSASTLASFSYSTAPAGNVLTETDSPTSAQFPATYAYDAKSQLTSMTPGTGSTATYGYDASGNMTTLPTGAGGSYNAASELTSSTLAGATTNYTYNADGDRLTTTQGSATIASGSRNGADQLTSYSDSAANMTAATYAGTGLRAAASTTPAGGGASTQQFTWGPGKELLQDSTNAYIYAGPGTPAEQVNLSTGTVSYPLTDMLGSVRGIVSSGGALTATTAYDAWGNPQTSGGLTANTPFGFAGGYTDPTGLIYLIDRYYDPQTGQFLSVDPDVAETGNPYGYAGEDPVNLTDPTGDRPKGIGYMFQIGTSFTANEGVAFVRSFVCLPGDGYSCIEQLQLSAPHTKRIVDIWVGRVFFGGGWINEVKTGEVQASSSNVKQVDLDNYLLNQGGAWGVNGAYYYPVTRGTWWFLPSSYTKRSGSSGPFYQRLINDGLNIMLFQYRRGQNDEQYGNKKAGTYAMWDAAESSQRTARVYRYYPPLALSACPPGVFWVYP